MLLPVSTTALDHGRVESEEIWRGQYPRIKLYHIKSKASFTSRVSIGEESFLRLSNRQQTSVKASSIDRESVAPPATSTISTVHPSA
mmetsp:Transcript_16184/g.33481  ORF Transcript_16184/g.33481 Transcript_16184/m.33481 type:complete len:87 (+) Transcript_16184:1467-1727(+)